MKIKRSASTDKIEIQMTPMIDIVFQLLTFFVFSLKITSTEGDFGIKMPLGISQGIADPNFAPPLKVRMIANPNGELAGMQLNEKPIASFDALRLEIITFIGDERGPGSLQETVEAELDCDAELNYEHVIDAMTAISGYVDENRNVVRLIEKIKFAPPKP